MRRELTAEDMAWRPEVSVDRYDWDEISAMSDRIDEILGLRHVPAFAPLVSPDREAKDRLDYYRRKNYDEVLNAFLTACYSKFAYSSRPTAFRKLLGWRRWITPPAVHRWWKLICESWYVINAWEFNVWANHLLELSGGDRTAVVDAVQRLCPAYEIPGITGSPYENFRQPGGAALGVIERWLRLRWRHREGHDLHTAVARFQSYFTEDELPPKLLAELERHHPLYRLEE